MKVITEQAGASWLSDVMNCRTLSKFDTAAGVDSECFVQGVCLQPSHCVLSASVSLQCLSVSLSVSPAHMQDTLLTFSHVLFPMNGIRADVIVFSL